MALLNILQYPDERLHTVAKPVEQVDERIRKLVADMFETMYESRGIGLAAKKFKALIRALPADTAEIAVESIQLAFEDALAELSYEDSPHTDLFHDVTYAFFREKER